MEFLLIFVFLYHFHFISSDSYLLDFLFSIYTVNHKTSTGLVAASNHPHFLGYDAYKYSICQVKRKTYSTSHDLCIVPIFGSGKLFNFNLNLFSVRKSGCAATIILLNDNSSILTQESRQLISLFDIKVIKGICRDEKLLRHFDFFRDKFLYYVLRYFQMQMDDNPKIIYNRVFFYDGFDVYFEKDPFRYFSDADTVYFFQEAELHIRDNPFNSYGVYSCFDWKGLRKIRNYPIICSGTMAAGSVSAFLKFFDYFVHAKFFSTEKCAFDQGALNYVIHAGVLKKNGIKYHVFPPDGPVATCKIGPVMNGTKFCGESNYTFLQSQNSMHEYEVLHQYTKLPFINSEYIRKTFYKEYILDHIKKDAILKVKEIVTFILY
ncbi:hypothetical protein M9Y10_020596 [Tritrichomonas musculus]|uniref:Uncharacterized protein n=1 Tax=Tritrichomonas musculus TaxID=1915356 RepID=A0ABR2HE69_9EUKA